VGLDLDLEALNWCMENNINRAGADGYSGISLFHGNVLQPLMLRVSHQLFHGLIAVIAIDSDNFVEFIIPGLFNLVIVVPIPIEFKRSVKKLSVLSPRVFKFFQILHSFRLAGDNVSACGAVG
jgi:hypothetical protein